MASLFTDIVGQRPEEIESRSIDSLQWFQTNVRDIRRVPSSLLKENQNFVTRFELGKMYMFMYDAKTKDKLKYYDYFPITICLKRYSTGFMGVNLHYLPIPLRIKLLDRLVDYSNNTKFDESTILDVDYKRLKNLREIKPTLKRYLAGQVKSQFRRIDADEFTVATLLPVQNFKKASDAEVWRESRSMI